MHEKVYVSKGICIQRYIYTIAYFAEGGHREDEVASRSGEPSGFAAFSLSQYSGGLWLLMSAYSRSHIDLDRAAGVSREDDWVISERDIVVTRLTEELTASVNPHSSAVGNLCLVTGFQPSVRVNHGNREELLNA